MCQLGLSACTEHRDMKTSRPRLGTTQRSRSTIICDFSLSLFHWSVFLIARPSLASYHLGFCFIILSFVPICPGWSSAGCSCRLCGSDLIWRNCGRSIRKPTGKWGFLCSLAGAQATYPSPAAPGHSSLGHLLLWSLCSSHPKCSSPRRQFISNALERESLFFITWRYRGFWSLIFP